MKPPLRTKSVGTKVSEAEFALLEERARGAGMRLGEWVREALLSAPAEAGVDSGEVALAEVLALRSLLLNLHFRSATGEPVSEAEMRGLIERADGSKLERARERLEAVQSAARAAARAADPEPEAAAGTNRLSDPTVNYDAAGNQQVSYNGGSAVALTWDAEGRLASSTPAGGSATTYVYGADGQRAGKIVGGAETNYVRDLDGSLLVTYVNGSFNNGNQELWVGGKHFGTVSVTSGSATTQTQNFSLTNWLGTEMARTDPSSGIPTAGYISQPFGDAQTTLFGSDSDPLHFTGKERDAESGNDYFGARYYASSMGRFMSPDWSAQEEPVPYATMDDPQSLNLYSYVQNNPLWKPDVDGHGPGTFAWTAKVSRNSGDHQTEAKIETGVGKVAVGVGLVATAAFGDVPGSTAGALLVVNTVLGGTSTAVSGTTDVLGAATHTDVSEAQEVLSATQNIPGLVTTAATGNLKAGDAAATLGNAASLATSPKEALKNPATVADSAQTVKDSGGLIQGAVSAVRNFFSPGPPPAPKPPPPPSCSVAGACQ